MASRLTRGGNAIREHSTSERHIACRTSEQADMFGQEL